MVEKEEGPESRESQGGLTENNDGGNDRVDHPMRRSEEEEEEGGGQHIQFVVMTDAGKPVYYYSRRFPADPNPRGDPLEEQRGRVRGAMRDISGGAGADGATRDEEEVSKMCSLLRAMCGSVRYSDLSLDSSIGDDDDGGGEAIRCVQSGSQLIVFLSVGALTLVALSSATHPHLQQLTCPTAAFLRLQLEYLYGYILSTLTDRIQVRLTLDPSYDLRHDLGVSTDSALRSFIDDMGTTRPAPFVTCSVPVFFPLDSHVRAVASRTLKAVGDVTPNTLLALLWVRSELVAMVQPSYVAVPASDVLLLRHVVARQERSALDRRLWIPVCLPRLHASGYLHAYIHSLGAVTGTGPAADREPSPSSSLLLVFVGSVGTTDQFNLFRRAEASVRAQLGLSSNESTSSTATPSAVRGVLDNREIPVAAADGLASVGRQADDRRGSDEDYVDASGDGDRMIKFVLDGDISSFPSNSEPGREPDDASSWSLLPHIQASNREALVQEYLHMAGALHFLLRLNVPIHDATNGRRHRGNAGSKDAIALPQSITSPFSNPIVTDWDKRRIWNTYQRLSLKLRIGSATIEATNDAMDMIISDDRVGNGENASWFMMRLLEKHPAIEGICYITEGVHTFLALSGADFELYLTFPRSVPVRQAATSGGRLARRILLEQQTLFVANPLVWNEDGS